MKPNPESPTPKDEDEQMAVLESILDTYDRTFRELAQKKPSAFIGYRHKDRIPLTLTADLEQDTP